MQIEDKIKSIENDLAIVENYQNNGAWNLDAQTEAAEAMAEIDSNLDALMMDTLDKEQVSKVTKLLARFTRCQDILWPEKPY